MKNIFIYGFVMCLLFSCKCECKDESCLKNTTDKSISSEAIQAQNSDNTLSCKLSSEELQTRKETVLEDLKKKVIEKKELSNGYSFKFEGSDKVIDELTEFVKTERSCCSFFVFTLSFSGDGKEAWLSLTGPEGTKEMIAEELGL
jgi:hypothetical protein